MQSTTKSIINRVNIHKKDKNQIYIHVSPDKSPYLHILLWLCNMTNSRVVQLTLPKIPFSLEIRHLRRTEPQEPIAIYAICR